MTGKKKITKKTVKKVPKKTHHKRVHSKKTHKKARDPPTFKLQTDHEVALDFATKAYDYFKNIIKSAILFGSVEKKTISHNSDIDIILIIDDLSIKWDQELIAWYREELDKLLLANPYRGNLHINTIKLSTWWEDLIKGDPVVLNVLRNGQTIIDHAGFVTPLKHLLNKGKIKGTPEAIYQSLQRAPSHLARSRAAELAAVEGVYWSMVDAAHAALMSAGYFPPSPDHVMVDLKEAFVSRGLLKMKYVIWYKDIFDVHKKIDHKEIWNLKGSDIDLWQERAEEFMKVMVGLVKKIIDNKQE